MTLTKPSSESLTFRDLSDQSVLCPVSTTEVVSSTIDARQRDQQLRRLTNLLNGLPGAVVMLDGAGRVQQCNPAAIDLLGAPLLSERWGDVVNRAFAPRWDDGHDISLVSGRMVNISTQAMIDEPGQILLIKDVTETRQLQTQLNQAKRLSAKGEMAAALAHQIRTPLASAMLYLSNLQNHPLDDAARIKFTGKALSRLNHLEKLIEDMLLFARGGQFELEPVSLQKLLNDLQQQVAPHAEQAGFTFSIRSPILDCPIPANAAALLSALQNLVDNAIQAIGKGGELRLETDKINDRMVRISLIDNGPGIPDQVRERLFEPFVTSRANGTGLGLAVVQAVIRSHQGSIQLRETSSAGTRFEITLPLIGQKQEGAVSL